VEAVFGAPVQQGDVTVIPVGRIRWGVGGGGGESVAEGAQGSGGGGGVAADAIGYIEITSDGAIFRRIGHPAANPVLILVSAFGAAIVIRALAKLLR
jgi:uncharacterized spore protein YtfJ